MIELDKVVVYQYNPNNFSVCIRCIAIKPTIKPTANINIFWFNLITPANYGR